MKKSQIAYAAWPWGTKTKEDQELAAKEIAAVGYETFESVKTSMYAYDLDVDAYKAMLDSYGLKAVSFYFHLPKEGEEETLFGNLEQELAFVQKMGVTRATLQGTHGRPEVAGEESMKHNLDNMIKFAKIAKKYGIDTDAHPHVNTYFMFEDEIDYVMQNSDPDLIHFAPDTAHIAAAGADPVAVIKRYADRVNFIHLKDYKLGDGIEEGGWVDSGVPIMTCFHELGKGSVDFPAIIKILDEVNYTGPLCIELDQAPVSHAQSAKNSYEYLCKLVKD